MSTLDHTGIVARAEDRRPGSAPGLLVAPAGSPPPVIDVILSGDGTWERHPNLTVEEMGELNRNRPDTQWIWVDVNGLGDAEIIGKLGECFGFHRLTVEDVLHLRQRPKHEEFDRYHYLVAQVPYWKDDQLDFEQVSLFLGPDFVVTLQAYETNRVTAVLDRFQRGAQRLLNSGTDYLAYALLDVVVDLAFPVLEELDRRIEELEDQLYERQDRNVITDIHTLRGTILSLRRVSWSQQKVPEGFLLAESPWIKDDTRPYIRDVQDHMHRVLELAEQQREACSSLFDLHHSISGTQLNEVIKVLTIISTLFIPLTFIVGVYGMNFNPEASRWNMPELNWALGYPFAWILMLGCAIGMLLMFRRRGWL